MIDRIYKRPEPAKPEPVKKRSSRRSLIFLAIVLLLLAIPPATIVLTNMTDIQIPQATDGCVTIVSVRGQSDVGSLSAEGINHLGEMIRQCDPVRNPLTIARTYFRHRDVTKRDSEVWIEIMFPVEGVTGQYDLYLLRQNGNIAYISSPQGTQTLHTPFTAIQLHTQLSERTAPPATP